MLEYSTYFGDPDSHAILFDELFWDEIAVTQVNAIAECTTTLANNLKKMSESYQKKRHQILDEIACRDVYSQHSEVESTKKMEAVRLRHLIGFHFLAELPKLIQSSWGGDAGIFNQFRNCLEMIFVFLSMCIMLLGS